MSKIQVDYLKIKELVEIHGPVADPECVRCPRCGLCFSPSRDEHCSCKSKYVEDEFALV